MRIPTPGNVALAQKLREMADILEQQDADRYRVNAYRRAARTVEQHAQDVSEIARTRGLAGVVELPGIGRGIGAAVVELVTTGRWAQLERLLGLLEPEQIFQTLPGIGPDLARRIHETLHADTLEALEIAAHDGRLATVPGIGKRRADAIRAGLEERLGARRFRATQRLHSPPSVGLLLDVDREYLDKSGRGELRLIAPKRFNPSGEAWLSVLHTRREPWIFTALFSNTQKAHELHKTNDWVVIYFHRNEEPEAQCTIVTETKGALAGRRVVRGREGESAAHYAATEGRILSGI